MVFTTNKALKAWGGVLHDKDLGQAIIDRVLERGRLHTTRWARAIRTLHLKLNDALKDESDQDVEVARIFRNPQPEHRRRCRSPSAAWRLQSKPRPSTGLDFRVAGPHGSLSA